MRTVLLSALLLSACSGKSPDTGVGSGTTSGSTTDPVEAPLVQCAPSVANQLRMDCSATTVETGALVWTWGPPGEPESERSTQTEGPAHTAVLWGLPAGMTSELVVRSESGLETRVNLVVPALPAAWQATFTTVGSREGEPLLFPLACADAPTLGVVDAKGRVVAYHRFEGLAAPGVAGFDWSDEGTFLALVGNSVREFDLFGNPGLSLDAADFPGPPHHEVHRGPGGVTWILTAYLYDDGVDSYVFDRLLGFRNGVEVARWDSGDHLLAPLDPNRDGGQSFWVGVWPDAVDYTHTNGVWAADDGSLYLSMRKTHTVYKLRGDPDAVDFGTVEWRLAGGPQTPEPSDFTFVAGPEITGALDFYGQHSALPLENGGLAMFDNRRELEEPSRGLVYDLDPVAGTATLVEDYTLPDLCPNQGTIREMSTGDRVIACPATGSVRAYAEGAADPHWTLLSDCSGPVIRALPAPLPVSLP